MDKVCNGLCALALVLVLLAIFGCAFDAFSLPQLKALLTLAVAFGAASMYLDSKGGGR